ncbi:MAG: hypothetical protein MR304_10770 [Eubacterium sp.]|nr:hypothetical protein [Eubacterium sp.]
MEEIKKFIQKVGVMRLGLVVVCGVLLLFLSYSGEDETPDTEPVNSQETVSENGSLEEYKRAREEELKELLQKVDGVGKAEVMITLKASNEKVTLKDNTNKGETNEEKTVLVGNSDRDSSPYIIQEKEPQIEGIVIVCQGGYDSVIKREITDAVSALFSIESHKIKIMKSKEAKE